MKISARVLNSIDRHAAALSTDGTSREIAVAPRPGGFGSSATGGELLCLASATCHCNDVYREARKRGIEVARVEVEDEATLDREGCAIERISHRARVTARAPESAIVELMRPTECATGRYDFPGRYTAVRPMIPGITAIAFLFRNRRRGEA